jgi:tetratricopeptide (TPR) repeat protein
LNKLAETDPTYVRTHEYLSDVYLAEGRYEDAIREMEKRPMLSGEDPAKITKGKQELLDALRAAGPKGFWSKLLEFVQQDARQNKAEPDALIASIYAQLGERDKAIEYLNKAIDRREVDLIDLKVAPKWDPLRSDPKFADILRRINYAP